MPRPDPHGPSLRRFGRSRRSWWPALPLLLLLGAPCASEAQTSATLAVAENFRDSRNGALLGRLEAGTRVRVEARDGSWTRVTVEGVVWIPSLQVRREGGFQLVVSAPEGENLREEPAGRVAGRFESGTLLEELGRIPGWVRVRRSGWIWTASLGFDEGSDARSPAAGSTETVEEAEWIRAGASGSPILGSPDGDTLAVARARSELRVLGREGNWTRVRVEGWVWSPATERDADDDPEAAVVLRDVTPLQVMQDPERYRGRLVEMTLQFVSLERAERIRTDFHEGEPFLLTRSPGTDRSFVYVAVPPERVAEAERLAPLERIRVVGRVRTASAALTGSPVLDLVELRRVP